MNSFNIYCFLTILSTAFFFYKLYIKEQQIFVFSIYLVKSKFHFCLLINFILMTLVISGKLLIKFFFGEVRLSEMMQVIDKIRMKVITFLLLFLTFRPNIDLMKIFIIVLYHFISVLTLIAFKRSAYIVSSHEKSKILQGKIIFVYLVLGTINYYIYKLLNMSLDLQTDEETGAVVFDSLIYYIFSCEFLFILLKVVAKFVKLIMDITANNLQKEWNQRNIAFHFISFVRYAVKLKFCVVLVKSGVIPLFFLIDVFTSCWHLVKLGYKLVDNYKTETYINSLPDYNLKEIGKEDELLEDESTKKHDRTIICNVCLGEVKHGKYLNCGHVFHLKCIKGWVIGNSGCPICKTPVVNEDKPSSRYLKQQIENREGFVMDQLKGKDKSDMSNLMSKYYMESLADKDLLKYSYLKKMAKVTEYINNEKENEIETGAITYSLPCAAVYNRSFLNEVKRLEVEMINRRMLEIYDNPTEAFEEYLDAMKSKK